MSGLRNALASKLYIWLAALAYRALITASCCCRRWRNGYWWLFGAIIGGVIGLRGDVFVAFCWRFLCFTLRGVDVSGVIICTLLYDWLGGGGVMLSQLGVTALMSGTVGCTVMCGIVTLGKKNDGATLGGEIGSCFDDFFGT